MIKQSKNERVYFDADTRGQAKDQKKGDLMAGLYVLRQACDKEISEDGERSTQMVCRFYLGDETGPDYWNLFVYWYGDHYEYSWQWIHDADDYDDDDYIEKHGNSESDVLREVFYTTFADSKHGHWPTWEDMTDVWVEC